MYSAERALLMQSEAHNETLRRDAETDLSLRAPLPEDLSGGRWGEDVYVSAAANAKTICVGDVLAVSRPLPHNQSADRTGSFIEATTHPKWRR